jgi:EmrB/QacA subfamily drug resistance transporter
MTSLNLALPDIARQLRATQSDLQWIVDGYALVLAALVLPAGALGDRFGRKPVMLAGLVVLTAALALGAGSATPGQLLAARMVAGAGAALIFPATLATITAVFRADQRGMAIGLWAAAATIGGVIGLIGSGGLVESFWWGSVLLATAGVAVATLVLTIAFAPNSADPDHAHLDPGGSVLSAAAVGGVVLGVTEGPVRGWSDHLTVAALAVGVISAVCFVAWELRARRPLLDVRVFADREFSGGALVVASQFFSVFGVMFLAVQYLSFVKGYGSLASAAALAPLGALVVPAALVADPLTRRFGRGRVSAVGLAIMVVGVLALVPMDSATGYPLVGIAFTVIGAGFGLGAAPATAAIVGALPAAKQGVASAINDVAREFGGALGVAAIGSAFNGPYRARIGTSPAIPEPLVDAARDSVTAGLHAAASLGPTGRPAVVAIHDAFVHGWAVAMATAAVVLAAAAVVTLRTSAARHDRHVIRSGNRSTTDPRAVSTT